MCSSNISKAARLLIVSQPPKAISRNLKTCFTIFSRDTVAFNKYMAIFSARKCFKRIKHKQPLSAGNISPVGQILQWSHVLFYLCDHVRVCELCRSQMERDLVGEKSRWKAAYLDKTISHVHTLRLSTKQFERQQLVEKILHIWIVETTNNNPYINLGTDRHFISNHKEFASFTS